jgi:hypothetical protein
MFASVIVGSVWAPTLGMIMGFSYAAFAFNPIPRALAMTVSVVLMGLAVTYVSEVRQDAIGVGVLLLCASLAFALMWPYRHRLQNEQGGL